MLRISPIFLQFGKTDSGDTGDHRISCIVGVPGDRFVLGTRSGRLVVRDFSGKTVCELASGGHEITAVSCDDSGEYVCATSLDRTVTVWKCALGSSSNYKVLREHTCDNSLVACAINSNFSKDSIFAFADSEGNVFRGRHSFFKLYVDVIASKQCSVTKMHMSDSVIAWATARGIVVWKDAVIYDIEPPLPGTLMTPWTSFVNVAPSVLGVAFGCFYYELHLDKKRRVVVNMGKNVIGMVLTEQRISIQLVSKNENKVAFNVDNGSNVSVVKVKESECDMEHYVDFVNGRGASHLLAFHNLLYRVGWEVSAKSLLSDISALSDEQFINKCKEAFQTLSDPMDLDLINKIIEKLVSQDQLTKSGLFCAAFLGDDIGQWDRVIMMFEDKGVLKHLIEFIPVEVLKRSQKKVNVLRALFRDSERFFRLFSQLPVDSFPPNDLAYLISKCRESKDVVFKLTLMDYYKRTKQWHLAFDEGLSANYLDLFRDIENQREYGYVCEDDKFCELCNRYGRVFAEFLSNHANETKLVPQEVLKLFERNRSKLRENGDRNICDYLHCLYQTNPALFPIASHECNYATILACLYMKYHEYRPLAMEFITKTELSYDYNIVLKTALDEKMYYEAVEVSRKSGDTINGMRILLDKVKKPEKAVEYALKYGNEQLDGVVRLLIDTAVSDTDMSLLICVLENLASFQQEIVVDVLKQIPPDRFQDRRVVEASHKAVVDLRKHLRSVQMIARVVNNRAFERAQMAAQQAAVVISIP